MLVDTWFIGQPAARTSSVVLFLLCCCMWFGWKQLPFVVPATYQVKRKTYLRQAVLGTRCIACILFPLDIQIRNLLSLPQLSTTPPPLLIVLDVSLSMSAEDIEPSRMEAAIALIDELLLELPPAPVGVIVFAGVPRELIPMSTHRAAMRQRIEDLAVGDFPLTQAFLGTAMGDALLLAHRRLLQQEQLGSILLISDGDPSKWVNTQQVAEMLARDQVRIHTLVMGTGKVLLWIDRQWEEVYAETSQTTMQMLANRTQGSSRHRDQKQDYTAMRTAIMQDLRAPTVQTRTTSMPVNDILLWWIIWCMVFVIGEKSILLIRLRGYTTWY
jgi:Mg-chelatase subunit ChlD